MNRCYRKLLMAMLAAVLLQGCDLFAVKEQQQKIAEYCRLYGSVQLDNHSGGNIVVALLKFGGNDVTKPDNWILFDHFVNDGPGKWYFSTAPGDYFVTAFEDRNSDLIFQPDEPAIPFSPEMILHCGTGESKTGIALTIKSGDRLQAHGDVDIAKTQARNAKQQFRLSLGQLFNIGEIVSLDDPRFSEQVAKQSLWRPLDFLIDGNAGLYFLEPYTPDKIPVLFVHGINGSPRNFAYLTQHIDRKRFQPWLAYYPSGGYLDNIAQALDQFVQQLQLRYKFEQLPVIAHSMGGLVARSFILQHAETATEHNIPLFVTLSTPWNGHKAAQLGVEHAPTPVNSWKDMAPGSRFLNELFYASDQPAALRRTLPPQIAMHLLFGFIDGEAGDGTVALASELRPEAQQDATRLYGFESGHDEILAAPEAIKVINDLLEGLR